MVVSWPKRIADTDGLRFQFHHVIDIAPTLLEVVGITEPAMVNGAPQRPIDGVSLAYTYHYNWFDVARYEVVSRDPAPTGDVELKVHFRNESQVPGGPATVRLAINGKASGEGRIEKQVRSRFGVESLDVGIDTCSPVSKSYPKGRPGFPFTGRIERVTFEFDGEAAEVPLPERVEQYARRA